MIGSVTFQICSLVYLTLLMVVYFSKERVDNHENKIYAITMFINFIALVLDILSVFTIYFNPSSVANLLASKLYLVSIVAWLSILSIYIFVISVKDEERKLMNLLKICPPFLIISTICTLIIFFLPIKFVSEPGIIYSYGQAPTFVYGVSTFFIALWFIRIIIRFKYVKKKKCIPVVFYVILGMISSTIQNTNPEILLISFAETFCTFLMYFTIENPDVKMIEELELARDAANKANAAKTDFLSSMSHEIRTPLNAIVGFSDCITEASSLDEAKENAKDIVNASETLLEIVNGILDISKIEAGKLEIVNSTYNAHELFEELAKLIKPRVDDKALDFSYYIAPDLPSVLYGDHANLKKIVTNLLSNASKYTDAGFVRYEVNCVITGDTCKLIISVEDSGRGIKKDSLDKLFTKFQRLDEDKNTTIEGTGLGLAITKQLIELMGGKIIVHTIYGEGSKFTVVLNQRIEKAVVKQRVSSIKDTLNLAGRKILLVDDNNLNLKVATKLLEKFGADSIECADSGFLCLDKVKSGNKYDVILLDDMMPKMSGVETLHKLKELDGFNIPVVALTANAITGMKEKYLKEGFNDYLAKPIEKNQLIVVLNKLFDNEEINTGAAVVSSQKTSISHVQVPVGELSEEIETLDEPVEDVVEREVREDIPVSVGIYDEAYLRNNGVDMDNALGLLGDMEMYNDTLKDYLSEIDQKLDDLKKYKDSNDMPNYSVLVHSMKSDAKYLGFMSFADVAYEHELKSKENNSDFVNQDFPRLEEELNKVLKIAKEYGSHI